MNFYPFYRDYTDSDDNELFTFYANTLIPLGFDFNKMVLKGPLEPAALPLLEDIFLDYAKELKLSYYSFEYPYNLPLGPELLNILEKRNYGLSMLKHLVLDPKVFKGSALKNKKVIIRPLNATDLQAYDRFEKEFNLPYGEPFAKQKQDANHQLFDEESVTFLGAFLDGKLVGSSKVYEASTHFELDDVGVSKDYRHLGIASALEQYLVQKALKSHRLIELLADGDDTPYEMYLKQGYVDLGFHVNFVKPLEDSPSL